MIIVGYVKRGQSTYPAAWVKVQNRTHAVEVARGMAGRFAELEIVQDGRAEKIEGDARKIGRAGTGATRRRIYAGQSAALAG